MHENAKGQSPLKFQELERLRLFAKQLLRDQAASLDYFAYRSGYKHLRNGKNDISISSTATCVLSLVATGKWNNGLAHDKVRTKALLRKMIRRSTSAGLPSKNPFTIAWILETVTELEKEYSDPLDAIDKRLVARMEAKLQADIRNGDGGVSIDQYPSSPYLT